MTDQPADGLKPQADPIQVPGAPPAQPAPATEPLAVPSAAPEPPAVPSAAMVPPAGPAAPTLASTSVGLAYAPAPVQPVNPAPSGRRGLRWLVAAAIVVLVAASASAAFFVVTGAASPSTVARWAPADSIVYLEARFDLPGDQHDKAGRFLSAFPGFADPSTLDAKLAEVYDKAIRAATHDKRDYSTEIKPWFGGQVGVAVSALPSGGAVTGARSAPVRCVFILSVTDAAKAGAWLTTVADGKGTAATYGGVALTVFGTGDQAAAVGVDGPVLIGGDVASVHAVIDAKGADGLAGTADFKVALANTPKDRVGFAFLQYQKLLQGQLALLPSTANLYPKELLDQIPPWIAMTTLFEADGLVMDEVHPAPTGHTGQASHVSTLAARLPATTVAAFEAHDIGTSIKDAVKLYQGIPAYKDAVTKALEAIDKVGGLDSFTSWLSDGTVAVTIDGTTVGGGVVLALVDKTAATAAAAKFASLKNLVTLAGLPGAKVTTEEHGTATITTIDLGSVNDLRNLAPFMGSGSSTLPSTLPPNVTDARLALSYTVTDDLAIVGIGGDGFVKAVLDTKAGASLADQARYRTAVGLAGASNAGQGYVDVAAIVKLVEAQLPTSARAAYERDTKPYVSPFSALVFASQDGDLGHSRIVVTVAK